MEIFRDGRVLVIDDSGAWQGRIDASRIDRLERDLAAMPLLQTTRFVEFSGRRPILHGGISYVCFRDGDREVIVAAPGIPVDAEWKAIIDRVKVERPQTLIPFRPEHLRFRPWKWEVRLTGQTVVWPFTSMLPLASHSSEPVATSDSDVIAFVIAHTYDSKFFGVPVEENGVQYGFSVDSAPGWMDPEVLQNRLAGMWRDGRHGRGEGSDDENLIEYGSGGFADGGVGAPMLYPAEVKIYAGGRIVFGDKDGYWQGIVDPKRLARLERDLANNPLLKKSRLLPVRHGGMISFHGGMAYIRYRCADDEVIVAVVSHPRRGPYVRLLERIRREIPTSYTSFRPKEIAFRVYPGNAWRAPVEWPFSGALPLQGRSQPITTTDSAVIAFVIGHSFGGFSWMQTNVSENGTDYELILTSAPGWYEPDVLGPTLGEIRLIGSNDDAHP